SDLIPARQILSHEAGGLDDPPKADSFPPLNSVVVAGINYTFLDSAHLLKFFLYMNLQKQIISLFLL
ncbi:MAG: hypothetical protein KKH32_03350, partial [Bacteroidetes bacterium]|nr:hypothetical protein [Bacteroidota bacterium]